MSPETWFERWLPEIVLAVIAGLLSLVRVGDVQRINSMEARLSHLEEQVAEGELLIREKLDALGDSLRKDNHELRRELNLKHDTLLVAIINNGKGVR